MFDDSLFKKLDSIVITKEVPRAQLFLDFICELEGWKTKCKNLHWSAPKKNIHVYLDEFLDILGDYQDSLAEGHMGIEGKMQPNAVRACPCECLNATDMISEIRNKTIEFYEKIPKETIYKGITSECETFIQNINKYNYLFSLCDVRPY